MKGSRVVRLLTGATIAGAAVVSFTPVGYASVAQADSTVTVAPTAEAWYQPNPTCATPAGCVGAVPVPPVSPYPADTLHIGVSVGEETARSYLALPLVAVSGDIIAATLTVPLDADPADGDVSSPSAKVQVCVTSAPLAPARGSFDAPPATDCSVAAPATYIATPQPHLEADLGPLVDRLRSATGLVLLPDATQSTPTDSWRVVFFAHDATGAANATAASVTLNVHDRPAAAPTAAPPAGPSSSPSGRVVGDVRPIQPPLGTGFAVTPSTPASATPVATPAVGPAKSVPAQFAQAAYAYPGVWLLPLALLVLVPLLVNALTTDLVRAPRP